MKDYEVVVKGVLRIKANNRKEAVAKAAENEKGCLIRAEYVHDLEDENIEYVIGYCENTGLPIFENDDYLADSEGVMWLNKKIEDGRHK